MSLKDLEEFLNDDNNEGNNFDWEKEKTDWLTAVDDFYRNITEWLKPITERDNSNLKITLDTLVINEEDIGEYEVKKMNISLKGKRVVLEPIGTMLIGARGRIDMKGTYGTVRFVLVDKRLNKPNVTVRVVDSTGEKALNETNKSTSSLPNDFGWKIITPPPNVQYIPLNEETFTQSLLSVIRNV
ncbi:hypothetical protein [Alkalihalobacillus deserti]|uniref:hypothetical protein n=1 Tax=Alkalihalobacillus deserti TaxID=2879466 RepID=UPI001D1441BD|nr:hypothetical protein [Alkalihalobacillus deserti]